MSQETGDDCTAYNLGMIALRVVEIPEIENPPVGWEIATENGWGYLTLVGLQECGLLSKIVRVPRETSGMVYREDIDESIRSYVEDTLEVTYVEDFLEWQWYFLPQNTSKNFWSELNTEVYFGIKNSAPAPEENYRGIRRAVRALYGAEK